MQNLKTKFKYGIRSVPFLKKQLYRISISFITGLLLISNVTIPTRAAPRVETVDVLPYTYTATHSDGSWVENNIGLGKVRADGEDSFCVEPMVVVNPGADYTTEYAYLSYSDEQRLKMEDISYAGYQMTSKTDADYAATQFMIWETLGWSISTPNFPEYASYKIKIQERMKIFEKAPSFDRDQISLKIGESVTLTDTNGVFSEYWFTSKSEGIEVIRNGNNLTITANANAPENAEVKYQLVKKECVGTSILYASPNSQNVIPFKHTDPYTIKIRIQVEKYGRARITKLDEVTGKVVKRAGIVYDIYRASDESLISTVTSNEDGIAETGQLSFNQYYYIERIAPDKYLENKERHYFTIDKSESDLPYLELSISDKPVTVKSTIRKEDKETGTIAQGDATLDGAIYGFYAGEDIYDHSNDGTIIYHKDDLISTHTIKNGSATVTSNYPGIYYWLEDKPSEGYLLDPDKHFVNLNYADQDTAVVVKDTVSLEQIKKQPIAFVKLETPGHGIAPTLGGAELTLIPKKYVELYGSFEAAHEIAKLNDGRILPTEWTSVITADDGTAMTKPMPYCHYAGRETVVPKDHYPVDDFEIIVSEQSDTPVKIHYLIDETLETALKIVKTDAETGKTVSIAGMRFKVKVLTKTADFNAGDYFGWQAKYPNWEYIDEFVTNENGDVILEKMLKAGTYQIEEVGSEDPYLLNHEPVIFTITEGWHQTLGPDGETLITTVEFANHQVKGQVRINKIADIFKGYTSEMTEYGELFTPVYEPGMLAGAKFRIKSETDIVGADGTIHYRAGEEVESLITDGVNITESSFLPIGTNGNNIYSIQEYETQEGYAVDETIRYFRFDYVDDSTEVVRPTWVDKDGKPIVFDGVFKNEKQTAVAITNKVMEESDGSNDVSDAHKQVVFGLFSEVVKGLQPDSLVGIGKVDDDHQINIPISQDGSYYLQELATDDRYQLDPNRYPVQFVYNGDQIQTITVNDGVIENKLKRATIEIIKYTEDDLYYSSDEQAKLAELGVYMSEYMRNDRLGDGRNYLAFHEFELAADPSFTNIIRTGITDINGRLVFDELELATYYIREKNSSDFYEINDQIFKIILSEHGQFETVEVKNDLMTSYVDIKKVDYYDQTKTLPFAGFTMYADSECTHPIQVIHTGLDGIARFDVKFGQTVYFKESSAPAGYGLSDKVVKVTIDENWVNGDKETRVIIYPDHPFPSSGGAGTGDASNACAYILLIFASGGLMFFLKKRYER